MFFHIRSNLNLLAKNFGEFLVFLGKYLKKNIILTLNFFEKEKDIIVRFFTMKRGRYSRPFLHLATIGVLGIGVLITPVLADTYPIFSSNAQAVDKIPAPSYTNQSIEADQNVFHTDNSVKERSSIITYTVEAGDTLSSVAQKFGISVDTIRWANSLSSGDTINVGDTLQILPVTGVAVKVASGDTVYSIAKRYSANPQAIADFPFNEWANPETLSLVVGEILIVPDGSPVQVAPVAQYYVQVPAPISGGEVSSGGFIWPIQGIITQYFSWYHPALDIAGAIGTPIVAAKSGVVAEASCGWNTGYGCNVILDNGGGFSTLYAHMVGQPNVSVGQSVGQGQVIGYRGDTGNSTGPHTHFEIRIDGHGVNPIPYLP